MSVIEAVAALFAERTGFSERASRAGRVDAALSRLMQRHGLLDPEAAVAHLSRGGGAFDELVNDLVIGETYFFRDPEQLEMVRSRVLSALPAGPIRVWSAGCASGEEAYSLAMLLDDAGLADRATILGTDISRAALARAALGVYRAWSLRGLSPAARARWFAGRGQEHVVDERLRRRVRFAPLNLATDTYPAAQQLILCRNVLIYFAPETVRRVSAGLVAALADGGWLVLGASDPPLEEQPGIERVTTAAGLLYRRGATPPPSRRAEPPPARLPAPAPTPPPPPMPPPASAADALAAGEYATAARLAALSPNDAAACALRVRALANLDAARAADAAAEAVTRHPLSAELHHLHAAALLDLKQTAAAAAALRRVLYLEPENALAHLLLATALRSLGDAAGSARALRNALKLGAS